MSGQPTPRVAQKAAGGKGYGVYSFLGFGSPESGQRHFGVFVIPQGQAWSVTDSSGSVSNVAGPKTLRLLGSMLTELRIVVAKESEYIEVRKVTGESDILAGPHSLVQDPLLHVSCLVKPAISVNKNEALVVYRESDGKGGSKESDGKDGKEVLREVVLGPVLYKPKSASQWTHNFSWHGHDSNGDKEGLARKKPHALRFTKLMLAPSSMYYDVENVRTGDDALLTVRLMIFYQLESIEAMLDATNDPMADMINAASADVIQFCSARSFEQFKEQAEQLNRLGLYSSLTSVVASRGLTVSKVVFRGFIAPQRLQKMHDESIERRTKLVLERESEIQEQRLADERLAKEDEREKVRRQMEVAKAEHLAALQRADFEARQRQMKEQAQQELELATSRQRLEQESLAGLKESLGLAAADLASLLVARAHVPSKLIQVAGSATPVVHVDQ